MTIQHSTDPRYLLLKNAPDIDLVKRNNCVSYAISSDDTVLDYSKRPHPLLQQPDLGDAVGVPWKLYQLALGYGLEGPLELAELNGLKRLHIDHKHPLKEPDVPKGHYLVAMFYSGEQTPAHQRQYHFIRKGADGVWTHKFCDDPVSLLDQQNKPLNPFKSYYGLGPYFFAVPEGGVEMRMPQAQAENMIALNDALKAYKQSRQPSPQLATLLKEAADGVGNKHLRLSQGLQRMAERVAVCAFGDNRVVSMAAKPLFPRQTSQQDRAKVAATRVTPLQTSVKIKPT